MAQMKALLLDGDSLQRLGGGAEYQPGRKETFLGKIGSF